MAVETVTVRMSRSDGSTPWGFRLQGGQEYGNILTIGPVAAGSLADRAGLHNGDAVTQLCGRDAQRMPHQDAQNIIVSSGNTLDLIVQRAGGAHIWKPSITQLGQDTTVSKFQHTVHSTGGSSHAPPPGPPPPPPMSAPPPQPAKSVKVSLEHQPQTGGNIPGYNSAARPFNTSSRSTASSTTTGGPEVKHLQYNSPLNLYSQNNAAEQYLQQTGGLFGTDPNLNKAKEEPAYLKSATLRLIQESEQDVRSGRASPRQPNEWAEGRSETLHHTDAHQQSDSFKRLSSALGTPAEDGTPIAFTANQPYVAKETVRPENMAPREASPGRAPSPRFDGGVPVCYCCGRSIIGVFCKASGKSLHPECFNCSTCGMSLKNIGHVLHNNKIYCETHGNQNKHLHFGAAPPVAPNAFLPRSVAPAQARGQEPVKAFYQPDIMARGPVRVSPMPWKSNSPISPSNRGVPRAPAMYGADLSSARNTLSVNVPSSHPISAPPPPPPSNFSNSEDNDSSQLPATHDSATHDSASDAPECLSDSKQVADVTEEDIAAGQQANMDDMAAGQQAAVDDMAAGQQATADTVAEEPVDENKLPTCDQKDQVQEKSEECTGENVAHKEDREEAVAEPALTIIIEPDQEPLMADTNEESKEIVEPAEAAKSAPRPSPIAAKLRASSSSDFAHSSVTKTAWPPVDRSVNYRYWRLPDIAASENQPSSGAFKTESFRLSDYIREQDLQTPQPRRDLLRGDTPPSRPIAHSRIVHNIDPIARISNSQATITKTIHEDKLLYKTAQNLVEEVVETSAVNEDKDIEIPVPQYPPSEPQYPPSEMSERWSEAQLDEDRTAVSEDTSSFAVPSFDQEITEFLNRELAIDRECASNNDLLNDADDENDGVADNFEDDDESQMTNVETLPSVVGSASGDHLPNFHAGPPEADRSSELTRTRSIDEESKIDEDDKKKVIESIERHQNTLQSQQEELSQLLDNAIRFLKDLDAEIQLRTPELSVNITQDPPHTPMNTPDPFEQRSAAQWPEQEVPVAGNLASPEISPAASEVSNILSLGAHSSRRYQGPADVILAHLRAIGSQDFEDADVYAYNSGASQHNSTTSTYNKFSSNLGSGTSAAPFSNGGTSPSGGATQPRRGRGILKQSHDVPRVPICEDCHREIRGPFVLAVGLTWCPDHFVCANNSCRRKLLDIGFVEEKGAKYCEVCFEQFMAPRCSKCSRAITGDCLNAIHKQWHPECFVCAHCHQPFGNSAFFLEEGRPYCERDWNQLFTTKCVSCKFPIEAGDRWVEALNAAYHSDCFNCTKCQKNLEGQSFYAKGGAPYCKAHA